VRPIRLLAAVVIALLAVTACGTSNARTRPPRATAAKTAGAHHGAAAKPNFVFLLTDDLDASEISVMPRLKSLLTDQGTTLSNYSVSVSWCCPSRSTTLRGQYAHNTQVWSNTAPNGGFGRFYGKKLEDSTIATWLKGAGYRTGLFGKYLNGYPEQAPVAKTYVPPGWGTWVVPAAGSPYHQFNYTLNDNGKLESHGSKPNDYLTDVLNLKVRSFIKAPSAKPFFAYVGVYNPHAPATPAPRHAKLFKGVKAPRTPSYDEKDLTGKPTEVRRLPPVSKKEAATWDALYRDRLRSLQSVDDMIGDLVTALRDSGRLDNTYFIFSSDNGFHIGQHRMPPGKNTAYVEDTRVPFVVRGPGVPAGRTVDQLAGNVDVAPTLADLAGVKSPGFVDGRSLAPLMRPGTPASWRQAFLLEHGHGPGTRPPLKPPKSGVLEPPELLSPSTRESFYLAPYEGLRTGRYFYVEYSTKERELYDLATDPNEMHNLAGDRSPPVQALIASFSARLKAMRTCAGATCAAAEDAR
jgi:N-acetylglucosamine-6-sulfatase